MAASDISFRLTLDLGDHNSEQEVTDVDISRLAARLPPGDMMMISVEYLDLSICEFEHCEENANKKSRPSYYRTMYCLELWRRKTPSQGSRQLLIEALERAQNDGLANVSQFQFLIEKQVGIEQLSVTFPAIFRILKGKRHLKVITTCVREKANS